MSVRECEEDHLRNSVRHFEHCRCTLPVNDEVMTKKSSFTERGGGKALVKTQIDVVPDYDMNRNRPSRRGIIIMIRGEVDPVLLGHFFRVGYVLEFYLLHMRRFGTVLVISN